MAFRITRDHLVELIDSINTAGINAAETGRFDQAIEFHEEAVRLAARGMAAKNEHDRINGDYLAVSLANVAYAVRRSRNDREAALSFLEAAMNVTKEASTHFGRGRVPEEIALVHRYKPAPESPLASLETGLASINGAIEQYTAALAAPQPEIVGVEKIVDRLHRAYGIASTIAVELSSRVPDQEQCLRYLHSSVVFAQLEAEGREKAGERTGLGLMNAYHTLAAAQTAALVSEQDYSKRTGLYLDAKRHLLRASQLATQPVVKTTLLLNKAWLEYVNSPTQIGKIQPCFELFLDQAAVLDTGVRDALEPKVRELGRILGGEFAERAEKLYSHP